MARQPGTERPYQVDDTWSRTVFVRRTGVVAEFLQPYLQPGMRLIDCGCGPGSITVDLADAVTPGETIGIDLRQEALIYGRTLARDRRLSNVTFQVANVYQLPFSDASFDAACACAVLQHLTARECPVSAFFNLFCTHDPERAWAKYKDGILHVTHAYALLAGRPPLPETPEELPHWAKVFLTPDQMVTLLQDIQGGAVPDHFLLWDTKPGMTYEEAYAFHKLFVEEVWPKIKDLK